MWRPGPDPIREALRVLTGEEPPNYVQGYSTDDCPEEHWDELQSWAANNAHPRWSTGIGILEAADTIVAEAEANGNIPRRPGPPPGERHTLRLSTALFELSDLGYLAARRKWDAIVVQSRGSQVRVTATIQGWHDLLQAMRDASCRDGWLPLADDRVRVKRAYLRLRDQLGKALKASRDD